MFQVQGVFRKKPAEVVFKNAHLQAFKKPLSEIVGSAARRIRPQFRSSTSFPAIIPPVPRPCLAQALSDAELLSETRCGMQILLFSCKHLSSPVIQELGRLREATFRLVGEGSGKALDIDTFDSLYQHIILWQPEAREICGAYRVGDASQLVAHTGVASLYCSSLFDLDDTALPLLQRGVELGRSFIQPAYQGTRALDYLWQGVGAVFERLPHCDYAFGAVSLSADYGSASTADIIAHFSHYYGATQQLAAPLRAYKPATKCSYLNQFDGNNETQDFRLLKSLLVKRGQSIPVLFKQYSDLCEAGGVSFMAYSVDPDFGNCIDAFVMVDINKIKPAKKARYFPNRRPA